jgi:hypothetical protein
MEFAKSDLLFTAFAYSSVLTDARNGMGLVSRFQELKLSYLLWSAGYPWL